jgi:hypothetical protein
MKGKINTLKPVTPRPNTQRTLHNRKLTDRKNSYDAFKWARNP